MKDINKAASEQGDSGAASINKRRQTKSGRRFLKIVGLITTLGLFHYWTSTQRQKDSSRANHKDIASLDDDNNRHPEMEIPLATSTPITNNDDEYNYGPSLLAAEIEKISHVPSQAKIVIQFKKQTTSSANKNSSNTNNTLEWQRLCANPFVLGRLSGPHVTLIHWERNDHKNTDAVVDQMVGYYKVPSSGHYFIEIIGILCNDFSFEGEYKDVCLEDPTQHRITHESAFIDVQVTHTREHDEQLPIGYWKWAEPTTTIPLFTRYQPQSCREQKHINTTRCTDPEALERFAPYEFVYNSNNDDQEKTIRSKAQALNNTSNKKLLCLIGLSHAREMAKAMNLWLREWNISNNVVAAQSLDAQFPRLVGTSFIQEQIIGRKCHKTVIACGQWSAGRKPPGGRYRGMPPTLFPDYQVEVRDMITRLKDASVVDFFLRSIHYNSLGDVKTTCPPQDWRSPPTIDRYNSIIQNLTTVMNVPYIDTNFIIGPMWDSAGDFCHYRDDKVASAEALYMLGRLL